MCIANMEKDKQPGSARFGNFINYYSFNPPERRISLLPDDLTTCLFDEKENQRIVALDVGCNAGDLTRNLYQHLTARQKTGGDHQHSVRILGVDVDPILIERAQDTNTEPEHISFSALNILDTAQRDAIVTEFLTKHEQPQFDIVFAFSVTMWIHLNNGDKGLREFLDYVSRIGRFLIIEPQPWKCYRTAVRRTKKLGCEPFEEFPDLTWRNEVDRDIEKYLVEECRMKLVEKFGQTSDWDRTVCLFQRGDDGKPSSSH